MPLILNKKLTLSLACSVSLLAIVPSLPAYAQTQDEPLDLTVLSTSEKDVSFVVIEDSSDTGNADAIEEAASSLDNATDQDDAQTPLADNNTTEAQIAVDNASSDISDEETGDDTKITQAEAQDNTSSEDIVTEDTPSDDGATTGRMKRRTIKDVGLASIGIGDGSDDALDKFSNRLWRGVALPRALRLIDHVPVSIASDALRQMSFKAIARQGVPPKGAAADPVSLLRARMDYLARNGRSDALAAIITQLPKNDDWQEWHEWKLFYDLMMRQDEEACAIAADNAATSLDALWQKTNLMCQILTGDEMRASFSADVLKASGLIDDPLYFDVIDVLLRRKSVEEVQATASQVTEIDFMHVILMDAAHVEISASQLASLSSSYRKAANALRYLSDEARQTLGLANLSAGLMTPLEAKALFVVSTNPDDSPLRAMTRRLEAQDNTASVPLYLAIRNETNQAQTLSQDEVEELISLAIQAVSLEIRDKQGALWVPFYAPLIGELMAVADMATLPADLQSDYAMIQHLAGLPVSVLPTDGDVVVASDHLGIILDSQANTANRARSMTQIGVPSLLPLLDDVITDETDWLVTFEASEQDSTTSFAPLSQTGMLALEQAAQKTQKVETIIIASKLISGKALSDISPSDIKKISDALMTAGLPNTSAAFTNEALSAHFMTILLASDG